MPWFYFVHRFLEVCLGRSNLWRISRKFYLLSRRDGSLDHRSNGERQLISVLTQRAAINHIALCVIDVGANHGEWIDMLCAAADRASTPCITIHAFEPVPELYMSLKEGGELRGSRYDLRVINAALSNESGRLDFIVTAGKGDHHLAAEHFQLAGDKVQVDVLTLDEYCEREKVCHIDIIKIDAEGFDPYVIQGARSLIQNQQVDLIQFEYGNLFIRTRSYLYDVFEFVKGTHYRIGRLTAQGIEVFESWHHDLERFYGTNYVIIHERAMHWVNVRIVKIDDSNSYD